MPRRPVPSAKRKPPSRLSSPLLRPVRPLESLLRRPPPAESLGEARAREVYPLFDLRVRLRDLKLVTPEDRDIFRRHVDIYERRLAELGLPTAPHFMASLRRKLRISDRVAARLSRAPS